MDWRHRKANGLFARLLGLYPADFRAEFGEEMRQLFADRSEAEPLHRLMRDVLLDTVRTAPKEHFAYMLQDIRYALRGLAANPAFTAVAVLSLAIGIGANSAMYSVANTMLLRPLTVADPSGLLVVQSTLRGETFGEAVSHADFLDLRMAAKSFQSLMAHEVTSFSFAASAEASPETKTGAYVTANFFEVAGAVPVLGRGFRDDEDRVPGRDAVVVLAHKFWQDTLHGDAAVLGRRVRLNGVELTVIGVAPDGFLGARQFVLPAFYVPIMMSPALSPDPGAAIANRRDRRTLSVQGRLRGGVSRAEANAEIETLGRNLAASYPQENRDRGLRTVTEFQARLDQSPSDAQLVGMLMGAAVMVLLLACVNVANLLLARGRTRAKELAIRMALGASRGRLFREAITESMLLALIGAMVSLPFAHAAIQMFSTLQPPTDVAIDFSFRLDGRVLLFGLGTAAAAALLSGMIPAIRALRPDVAATMKAGESARDEKGGRLLGRGALVSGQLALSCVLLIAAAMMVNGVHGKVLGDPGFRRDHLLLAVVDPAKTRSSVEDRRRFVDRLLERTRELPGVRTAAVTTAVPTSLFGLEFQGLIPEGYTLRADQKSVGVVASRVSEHYFETAGIPIVQGRGFARTDATGAPDVAIVNENFVRQYWPGLNPLGRRFHLEGKPDRMFEVVGVARNSKYMWVTEGAMEAVYYSARQKDPGQLVLMLHTEGDPAAFATAVRETVKKLDPNLPVSGMRTMEEYHERRTVSIISLLANTVTALGLMGLVLAIAGLYGTMAYSVSRRTKEIGIRMAIGASPGRIVGMVLWGGAWIAGIGIGAGLGLGVLASRALQAGFIGVAVAHPAVFVSVPVLLGAVSLAACLIPARRAASTSPTTALRCD